MQDRKKDLRDENGDAMTNDTLCVTILSSSSSSSPVVGTALKASTTNNGLLSREMVENKFSQETEESGHMFRLRWWR